MKTWEDTIHGLQSNRVWRGMSEPAKDAMALVWDQLVPALVIGRLLGEDYDMIEGLAASMVNCLAGDEERLKRIAEVAGVCAARWEEELRP